MGFFSNLRDRVTGGSDDDYYDDDEEYYEDEYDDGGSSYVNEDREQRDTSGLLGNTSRPEAESVSVYTRSGRPVSERAAQPDPAPARGSYAPTPTARETYGGGRTFTATLPPYVLRPVSYDDVQTVVKRVRTNQPVVLVLQSLSLDVAKRILDFCFGFSCGVNGAVEELGNRVFVVLPQGVELTDADIDKLVADGDLVR